MANRKTRKDGTSLQPGDIDPYLNERTRSRVIRGYATGDYVLVNDDAFKKNRISIPTITDGRSIAALHGRVTRVHESGSLPLDYIGKGEQLGNIVSVAFGRTELDGGKMRFLSLAEAEFQLPVGLLNLPFDEVKRAILDDGDYERVAALADAGILPGARWDWALLFEKTLPTRCAPHQDTPEEREREACLWKLLNHLNNLEYYIFDGPLQIFPDAVSSVENGYENRLRKTYSTLYNARPYDPVTYGREPFTTDQAQLLSNLGLQPAAALHAVRPTRDIEDHARAFLAALREGRAERAAHVVTTRTAKRSRTQGL